MRLGATAVLLLVCSILPTHTCASEYSSTGAQGFDNHRKGPDPRDSRQWLPRADLQGRCVFVLGTGRSGSTQLVDSLNQIPNYFIRGEQGGAFWHLYQTLHYLLTAWRKADEFADAVEVWRRSAYHAGARAANTTGASGRQQQQQPDQMQQHAAEVMHGGTSIGTLGLLGSNDQEQVHEVGGDGGDGSASSSSNSSSSGSGGSGGSGSRPSGAGAREAQLLAAAAEAAQGDPLHRAVSYPALERLKGLYHHHALDHKMPWFNDLEPGRLYDAVRAFYSVVYGYHGPGVVSGFKEIRFVCGRAFPSATSTYDDFAAFLAFLRLMCRDVKILLNSRRSPDLESNSRLVNMLERQQRLQQQQHGGASTRPAASAYAAAAGGTSSRSAQEDEADGSAEGPSLSHEQLAADLAVTHTWFDRYASEHLQVAMRVLMEDMFTPGVNVTLSRRLLSFLGEDPSALTLRFDRMPSWGARSKSRRNKNQK